MLTEPDPVDDYEMPADTSNRSRFKTIGVGIHARLARGEAVASALFVAVGDEWITLKLVDGRQLELPLSWSARLPHGTPAERNTWRLLHDGIAVFWPLLGEVISVEEALAGRRPDEDDATLAEWLRDRQSSIRTPDAAAA